MPFQLILGYWVAIAIAWSDAAQALHMITRIEDIPLDPDNLAFTQADEFVKHTDRLVY